MANRSCAFAVTLSESARWKPSGIPSATVFADREASVSSSFPSWRTLDGSRGSWWDRVHQLSRGIRHGGNWRMWPVKQCAARGPKITLVD
jgi:hypothetical protein